MIIPYGIHDVHRTMNWLWSQPTFIPWIPHGIATCRCFLSFDFFATSSGFSASLSDSLSLATRFLVCLGLLIPLFAVFAVVLGSWSLGGIPLAMFRGVKGIVVVEQVPQFSLTKHMIPVFGYALTRHQEIYFKIEH